MTTARRPWCLDTIEGSIHIYEMIRKRCRYGGASEVGRGDYLGILFSRSQEYFGVRSWESDGGPILCTVYIVIVIHSHRILPYLHHCCSTSLIW